uniref:Uncharacterized protein n=1 Tax=Rangifer tarandus platyrhynchus TaxID=3082113 RepID=A0ACB0E5H1_RANTA|nr:unnamed protein product [Rangifer tarandus platyrhynchus]
MAAPLPPSRVPADPRPQLHTFEYGQRSLSEASSQATRSPSPNTTYCKTQLSRQQLPSGAATERPPKTKVTTPASGARKLGKKTGPGGTECFTVCLWPSPVPSAPSTLTGQMAMTLGSNPTGR